MKKLSLFLIIALVAIVFYACNNTSEEMSPNKGTSNHNVNENSEVIEASNKILAQTVNGELVLVHSQEELNNAIVSAYSTAEDTKASVDETIEIISGINPETNEIGYGIAFSLSLSNGERHSITLHLEQLSNNNYVLSFTTKPRVCVASIDCVKGCKKPLFKDCKCKDSASSGTCTNANAQQSIAQDLSDALPEHI